MVIDPEIDEVAAVVLPIAIRPWDVAPAGAEALRTRVVPDHPADIFPVAETAKPARALVVEDELAVVLPRAVTPSLVCDVAH